MKISLSFYQFLILQIISFIIPLVYEQINCLEKHPLATDFIIYAGQWKSQEGYELNIYSDGTGDFKFGSDYMKGGLLKISKKELIIGRYSLKKTFKIIQPPYNEDHLVKMNLNGFHFIKVNYPINKKPVHY